MADKHHPAALRSTLSGIETTPSFYAHVLNALFLLLAAFILYKHFSVIKRLEPFKLLTLTLLVSVAVGIHGLTHLGLESVYGFNPLNQALSFF